VEKPERNEGGVEGESSLMSNRPVEWDLFLERGALRGFRIEERIKRKHGGGLRGERGESCFTAKMERGRKKI